MRIPYYLAQYQQARTNNAGSGSAVLAAMTVGGIVLLYVGMLSVLLLGGWA